jgi:DNA-binding response OmpR family regulator
LWKIKTDTVTKDIPIIFVTAKTEVDDIVCDFKVRSVDYIAKPFHREEVLSWVQTHLKIEQLIQDKESLNKKLQDLNNELVESQNQ